ncbi:MAG: hypothetical protein KA010_03135 [Saprospiraceae bacterium]|nr:hypothetical protein [Saprospiraceae bacterium]
MQQPTWHRLAVIDLGTNTFHLLITDVNSISLEVKILYKERKYVKLAENGIEHIGRDPYLRGLDAMVHFANVIEVHKVSKVQAIGTAALRTANNGLDFVNEIYQLTGVQIELISGMEEARLIQKGVQWAVNIKDERFLIMDIGGGSVEFIISDNDQILWCYSFPIGVSVLYNTFQHSDPISSSDIKVLEDYLGHQLKELKQALAKYNTQYLIGASGSFDVIESMLKFERVEKNSITIPIEKCYEIYDRLITTTVNERLNIEHLPPERAEMMAVALVLIRYVVDSLHMNKLTISDFALKEGILREML